MPPKIAPIKSAEELLAEKIADRNKYEVSLAMACRSKVILMNPSPHSAQNTYCGRRVISIELSLSQVLPLIMAPA